MNILLATDANIERAGVCLFMLQWIKNTLKLDKDINICAYFRKGILDETIAQEYRENGVKLVLGELPQNQTSTSAKNRNKVRLDIRTILREKQYDVIHVNSSALGFSSIVLSEGIKAKVPIRISHSHGRNQNNWIKKCYLWLLKIYNKKSATKYASCSKNAGQYLFGRDITTNPKWLLVPNTIPAERFEFDTESRKVGRNELGISDDILLLGATGMLTRLKNHAFMIEIVKLLNNRGVKTKLLILGEGEERKNLEKLIDEKKMNNDVILYGVTNNVAKWLSAMDLYLMTSLSEGLPIGAIEAQANGLCCILSDRIPTDIDICPDVYHLSIDDGEEVWAEAITKARRKTVEDRKTGVEYIKNAGFDQSNTQLYIRQLYEI